MHVKEKGKGIYSEGMAAAKSTERTKYSNGRTYTHYNFYKLREVVMGIGLQIPSHFECSLVSVLSSAAIPTFNILYILSFLFVIFFFLSQKLSSYVHVIKKHTLLHNFLFT